MITVHMTTHRRLASGLLPRAVESVLSQDFRDFEFVICDDASTDGTAAYLRDIAAQDARVKIVRHVRNVNSVSISLGKCFAAADVARPWVSWMFDDCVLLPGALTRLMRGLTLHADAKMIYGRTHVHQRDGNVLCVGEGSVNEVLNGIAGSSVLVPNGGILVHRDVFAAFGWYDASIVLRRSCDWDLFRRFILGGTPFAVLPDVLMEEFGDLQHDALRNAFTTQFDVMTRFTAARDASGARMDLDSVLNRPIDWMPPAAWSSVDLDLMRYMFAEYFLSVGHVARAFHWARQLSERLGTSSLMMRENLLRCARESGTQEQRTMASGAFAGVVLGVWREVQGRVAA